MKNTAYGIYFMGIGYKLLARPILSLQNSEKAHGRAITGLKITSWFILTRLLLRILYKPKIVKTEVFDLEFSNPLGLAAGMDKKAEAMRGWENLGFGFIEVGGITQQKQSGNPKPRMFRDMKQGALINRMGFNNPGNDEMSTHLQSTYKPKIPVFLNVGKSKTTSLENAHLDYADTVKKCGDFVDGFVINVSSPNTPNLRDLQKDEDLARIINEVKKYSSNKPVLVKISPDLEDNQIKSIVNTARELNCSGIIATNTTTSRPSAGGIMDETGGLSGSPLRDRSTEVIRLIADHTDGDWPIIGVGGISNSNDAWEKISNGASLVQLYSSLVFQGPAVIKDIVNGIDKKMKLEGYEKLSDVVGSARRI